jgi:hypothetical protein
MHGTTVKNVKYVTVNVGTLVMKIVVSWDVRCVIW